MGSIKVLLVDDHRLLREAVGQLLNQVDDIEVVGGLSSGEELVNTFSSYEVDIILMDIMLTGMTGLEATRWVKEVSKEIKVIIISSEIKKEYVSLGIKCGIDGYLPKDVGKDTLIEAIHRVMKGEKYFNDAITSLVFEDYYQHERVGTRAIKVAQGLTKRESEILEQVASGKTNTEVAEVLFISVKTVETHKTNILEKLGLRNSVELVRYAIKNGLINME
jgi:DNA-binding NarL/FixJ family response regulator